MGYYRTFVVKIWCDDCGEMIRGHIQHVKSQEHIYFLDLKHMTDFMVRHLGHSTQGTGQGRGSQLVENFGNTDG